MSVAFFSVGALAQNWPQWGQNPQHSGFITVLGQSPSQKLASQLYDPFVAREQAENFGELLAHYQAPLTNGQDVFMEFISGTYLGCNPPGSYTPFPCGNDNWFNQVWNEKRLHWQNGQLQEMWSFASDWKPEPDAGGELGGWQPVFHAALTEDAVWVPGAGGTVFKLAKGSGKLIKRVNPFGHNGDGNGVTDIPDAWLVKISDEGDDVRKVSYKSLTFTPAAPTTCHAVFGLSQLPWPPSPTATPRTVPCLSQRPGVNITPNRT